MFHTSYVHLNRLAERSKFMEPADQMDALFRSQLLQKNLIKGHLYIYIYLYLSKLNSLKLLVVSRT